MNECKVTGSYIRRVRLELNQTQPQFAKKLSRITGEKIDSKALCRLENYGQQDACNPMIPTGTLARAVVKLELKREVVHPGENPTSKPDIDMERRYYVRDKLRIVEQLDGVIAIKSSPDNRSQVHTDIDSDRLNISKEELEVFGSAGWVFRQISEQSSNHNRSMAAEETPSSRVFRCPEDGSILLGTQTLIVQLQSNFSPEASQNHIEQENLSIRRKLKFAKNLYEVVVPADIDPINEANKLHEKHSVFIFAEPVMIENIATRCDNPETSEIPEITSFQSTIFADEAWKYSRGQNVRIAVIDNGFDINHEALRDGIVNESGYFLDDEDNEFMHGLDRYPTPNNDHGTFCAGIVGARNNDWCGRGVAYESNLSLISCQPDQVGTQVTLARAIAYAANPLLEGMESGLGADVISCSLGEARNKRWLMQRVLELAIDYAIESGRDGKGTSIFWATSNLPIEVSKDEVCSHPNVIAVGRSDNRDRADGSAYGDIDFLAPGKRVYSTLPNNQYGISTGTSFSTPCAAGVAALVLSINPNLNHTQVRQTLRNTCDKVGEVSYKNGHHPEYGFGRINASRSVEVSRSFS
jgi:Subtilase family